MVSVDYVPTNTKVASPLKGVKIVATDPVRSLDESAKWSKLFEDTVLNKAGQVTQMRHASVAVPEKASGPSHGSFREVWLITLGHSLTHWYPATFYLILPIIGKELGLTYSQIGLIMTCQYLAGAIANVPGGILVDTVGRKGVLMALSLFWVGFPYLLMGFSHGYLMLLGCVALVGFGNSLWHPTAIPTLARRFPERKGLVLSIHGMGGNVGDALAPLAIGSLLAVLSWREVVMLNVVPGLVMSFLLVAMLGTLRVGAKHGGGRDDGRVQSLGDYFRGVPALFRNRSLVLLTASSAFRSMTQNALLTFLPVYLAYEMGYSPLWVGAGMFALQAAGFAATPIAGHLSDRMGRRGVMMTSMGMTAVVLLFMAFAGKSNAFIAFIAVLGFFLYAIRPVLQAWLLESTPKNMGGTSIGILFGAQSLGASVAPAHRRAHRGPLRPHRDLLVPRRHHRRGQSLHPRDAEGRRGEAGVTLARWLKSTSNRTFIVWPARALRGRGAAAARRSARERVGPAIARVGLSPVPAGSASIARGKEAAGPAFRCRPSGSSRRAPTASCATRCISATSSSSPGSPSRCNPGSRPRFSPSTLCGSRGACARTKRASGRSSASRIANIAAA